MSMFIDWSFFGANLFQSRARDSISHYVVLPLIGLPFTFFWYKDEQLICITAPGQQHVTGFAVYTALFIWVLILFIMGMSVEPHFYLGKISHQKS